jgi:hypothetical protein
MGTWVYRVQKRASGNRTLPLIPRRRHPPRDPPKRDSKEAPVGWRLMDRVRGAAMGGGLGAAMGAYHVISGGRWLSPVKTLALAAQSGALVRAHWVTLRFCWVMRREALGDAKCSLGDVERSLGDAKSSLGDVMSSRWVTLSARWVTLRDRWVTLRARWVTSLCL